MPTIDKLRIFAISIIMLGFLAGIIFWWMGSEDRYHQGIIESGGYNPIQKFEHVWSNYQSAGFDFSTAVCIELTDLNSTKIWTPFDSWSDGQIEIMRLARSFNSDRGCVGSKPSLLILEAGWHNSTPYSWELFLLDVPTKRLLLLAGTL